MNKRQKLQNPGFDMRVKKMSREVYNSYRRPVMDIIYMAKEWLRLEGVTLPRIELRITEQDSHTVNGVAYLGGCIIFIAEDLLNTGDRNRITRTVLHEIVHAVTGFEHKDGCALMSPVSPTRPLPPEALKPVFIEYMKS